jgi:hypothetical protein
MHTDRTSPSPTPTSTRFSAVVDAALRAAGWQPGRWDIKQAEIWADALRSHESPAGHRHSVFPAAVEAWAEFGGLHIPPRPPAARSPRRPAPGPPARPPHGPYARGPRQSPGHRSGPLGEESDTRALLAIDAEGRTYTLDHTGDWYLGATIDQALTTLVSGLEPERLTAG